MVWGGFLNKEGSEYFRIIKNAERTIEFLELLKKYLNKGEENQVSKTIEIIIGYVDRLSEKKGKDSDLE